ncbi:MAG: Upf1 family helicase, partial [Holophagales bacterium]|nr:Upf1 family helicase [Holophagales bacterium]
LRHLSFLSRRRQASIAQRLQLEPELEHRFDYRDRSLLDLARDRLRSQRQLTFLEEHFRSVPAIIRFSNRNFYSGRLQVMQEHPAHDYDRALFLHSVPGRRLPSGANPDEAEAALEQLLQEIESQREVPRNLCRSIGILSPFRAQVDLLARRVAEEVGHRDLERHGVRVGTPYAFQGEERDVMLMSLALDPEAHPSAFRYLERPDVFNVAVTRARSRQHVFTSLNAAQSLPDPTGLLARYLDYLEEVHLGPAPTPSDDPFLTEVHARLEVEGYRVWPAYPVAGMVVDLVLERDGRCSGLDLVGYPGEFAGSFELERYRLFNRAGLPLMPLAYSAWKNDSSGMLERIRRQLRRHGTSL